jgi:molybdopterin-guanine dinucleotide biosynthesis protein A
MSEPAEAVETAGFVLVGGKSSRMGRDKATLEYPGGTLVEAVAAEVLKAAASVALLGSPERYGHLGLRVIQDIIPGRGPMSGLHAALESEGQFDFVLLVACDMPDVEAAFLRRLITIAKRTQAKCVAASGEGGLEPLCAVYHRSTRKEVARALDEGRLRMRTLAAELSAVGVEAGSRLTRNVNTEQDWHLYLSEKERLS